MLNTGQRALISVVAVLAALVIVGMICGFFGLLVFLVIVAAVVAVIMLIVLNYGGSSTSPRANASSFRRMGEHDRTDYVDYECAYPPDDVNDPPWA